MIPFRRKAPSESSSSPEEQVTQRRLLPWRLTSSQRLLWTTVLGAAFIVVTWFAWSREADPLSSGPGFLRPIEINREFRPGTVPTDFEAVSFVDPQHGWVVGGGVVMRTIDGGASWRSVSVPSLRAISFVDTQRGWAVGYGGTIVATTDGGATWKSQFPGDPNDLYSVHFVDAQRGWAGGNNATILATKDGGAHWDRQSGNELAVAFLSVYFVDAQRGWAVGRAPIGGRIEATTDGGEHWHPQPYNYLPLESVYFLEDGQHGWAVGYGQIVSTSDGGANWIRVFDGNDQVTSVHFATAEKGWVAGTYAFLTTSDGGKSWKSSAINALIMSLDFVDAQRGWAVGYAGALLATTDGGEHWHRQPFPIYWSLCPPWYLWIAPLFVVGLVALNHRGVSTRKGILGAGFSDSAAATLEDDRLGASRLVNTLVRFIRNPGTLPPLCITVEGPWGTGKSSILQMIESQLRKKRAARTVWFNAWHHQKEDCLLAYLLEAIKRDAVPPILSPDLSGLFFRLDLLAVRLGKAWPHFLVAGAAFALALALPRVSAENIPSWLKFAGYFQKPLAVLPALGYLYVSCLRAFATNPEKLLDSGRAMLRFGDLRGKTDVRADFQRELKDVVTALRARNIRLVIFLDDLDRCRPEQVVVVMEAVNFLTAAADCFILLGTDRKKVLAAVEMYYKEIARELSMAETRPEQEVRRELANSYLHKMINLRTHVPQANSKQRKEFVKDQAYAKGANSAHFVLRRAAVAILVLGIAILSTTQKSSETGSPRAAKVDAPVSVRAPASAIAAPNTKEKNGSRVPQIAPNPAVKPAGNLVPQNPYSQWPLYLAVGVVVLVGSLFWLRVKLRPDTEDVKDRPEFLEALDDAAETIWDNAHGNPREVRRVLNMLRFLAASEAESGTGEASHWEPNLVGFAAFRSTDRFPQGWKWMITEEQVNRYQQLCRYAEIDPGTLEPMDDIERPQSPKTATAGWEGEAGRSSA